MSAGSERATCTLAPGAADLTTTTMILVVASTLATPTSPKPSSETGRAADTTAEALVILQKADAATRAARTIRYRAHAYATGWLTKRIAEVEGSAVITGSHEVHFRVARFDTSIRFPHLKYVQRLTYGADGTFYYLIDWDQKLAYEEIDPRVTGHGGRAAQQIGLREFVVESPFGDEINGDSVVLLAEKRIGKEPCYVVDVVYANNGGHAVWYFSKRDHLPRRVDRVYDNAARGAAMFVVELYDLETDPEIDSRDFALKLPDGFERSARFAPDVRDRPW